MKKMVRFSSVKLSVLFLMFFAILAFCRDWVALFGSRNCDECAKIKELWNESFVSEEDPVLVYLCVDEQENYEFLKLVEKELAVKRPSSAFPIMLIGDTMIAGYDGLMELGLDGMNELLTHVPNAYVLRPFIQAEEEAEEPVVEINAAEFIADFPEDMKAAVMGGSLVQKNSFQVEHPQLLYIFQTGCQKCSRQLKELRILEKQVPGLQVACYNIAETSGQVMLKRVKTMLKETGADMPELVPPLLAWDDGVIVERLATTEELSAVLAKQAEEDHFWNAPITENEQKTTQALLENVIGTTTVGVIAFAGLLDGINPCAFATSIFLIGYLLYLKRRPRQIVLVGASFCFGVFITYVLFGIGLSFIINYLNRYVWIKVGIYGLFAIGAAVLAIMNIHDAWIFKRTNKASQMNLGLSGETHHKMHERIRKLAGVSGWIMLPAAALLGTVISSMELACTGQIYLPTLAAINSTAMTWRAFSLLMLYNVAFIIPLGIVTGLAACGCGAKKLGDWARSHVFHTKVIMGVLFAVLTLLMLWFTLNAAPKNLPDAGVNCLAEESENPESEI